MAWMRNGVAALSTLTPRAVLSAERSAASMDSFEIAAVLLAAAKTAVTTTLAGLTVSWMSSA